MLMLAADLLNISTTIDKWVQKKDSEVSKKGKSAIIDDDTIENQILRIENVADTLKRMSGR